MFICMYNIILQNTPTNNSKNGFSPFIGYYFCINTCNVWPALDNTQCISSISRKTTSMTLTLEVHHCLIHLHNRTWTPILLSASFETIIFSTHRLRILCKVQRLVFIVLSIEARVCPPHHRIKIFKNFCMSFPTLSKIEPSRMFFFIYFMLHLECSNTNTFNHLEFCSFPVSSAHKSFLSISLFVLKSVIHNNS